MNTYCIATMCQAPSLTVSLNITETTFTQPASGEDKSSGHSQSTILDSTYLSSNADFTADFRHRLGSYFG